MQNKTQINLQPTDDAKASEAIYLQIREKIINGQIEEGSRLPSERKLMEMANRSRSTIREAMRMLERDGYIRTVSRSSGAIVQDPGVNAVVESLENTINMQKLDFAQVLEFRRMTETLAAQLAAERRTQADLEELGSIVEEAGACIGDIDAFVSCDLRFHLGVANASRNEMFVIMLNVCRNVIGERLTETLTRGDEKDIRRRYENIADTHRQIYEAIAARQAGRAYQIMEGHLFSAEKDIMEQTLL